MGDRTGISWTDRGLVPVSLITLRDECQPRAAGLDEDVVAEYVEALRRGDELPPLSVVSVLDPAHDLETYVLVDGYHRFAAHDAGTVVGARQALGIARRDNDRLRARLALAEEVIASMDPLRCYCGAADCYPCMLIAKWRRGGEG